MYRAHSVFVDPRPMRWPRVRLRITLLCLALAGVLGGPVGSILNRPIDRMVKLPGASLVRNGTRSIPAIPGVCLKPINHGPEAAGDEARLPLGDRVDGHKGLAQASTPRPGTGRRPLIIGFFVNWDDASLSSLKLNLDHLDVVIGQWLHLADDGVLRENDPVRQAVATDLIRARHRDMLIVPLINNKNGQVWGGEKFGRMLGDPVARSRAITQIVDYVERHRFAGISIDFEHIPVGAQPAFISFMKELAAVMRPKQLQVSVNVPASDPAFDYRTLARNADQLIVMAYDEHWANSGAGPIASLPWFMRVLKERQRDIGAEKMIVGIGSYAYEWQDGRPAIGRTLEKAMRLARESKADIHVDSQSLNSTFEYADELGNMHHVWMLDAISASNQLAVIRSIQPFGVALWRLGSEDPAIWNVLGRKQPPEASGAAQSSQVR